MIRIISTYKSRARTQTSITGDAPGTLTDTVTDIDQAIEHLTIAADKTKTI